MAKTIGEQLIKARLVKQLSLEQAAFQTRIRLHYLQALENNDRAALPSDVQAKGFLRLYASFLDIPSKPLVDLWDGKTTNQTQPLAVEQATPSKGVDQEEPIEQLNRTDEDESDPFENDPFENNEMVGSDEEIDPSIPDPSEGEEKDFSFSEVSPSEAILIEIGERLKNHREQLGLKLSDVERFTHIRLHYLNALEHGRLSDLPSPVQGRGMLSNYARFLDLNVDEILLRFADALQARRIEITPPPPDREIFTRRRARPTTGIRRFLTPDLMIGTALILALFGFAVWTAAQVSAMRRAETEPTVLPISEVMLTASLAPVGTVESTPEPTSTRGASAVLSEGENISVEEGGESDGTPTVPSLGDKPLQLYIVASQKAWMRVSVDGKEEFEGRTVPGNAYTFAGDQEISLVTGNAAALHLYYNQMDLDVLGGIGEVRSLVFNNQGMLTPTSQYSPTPTATELLTSTAQPSPTIPTPTVTPYIP